jgi:hypothetical protein
MANIGKWPKWLLCPFTEMAVNMAFIGRAKVQINSENGFQKYANGKKLWPKQIDRKIMAISLVF